MLSEKKLTVNYFLTTNAFYKAKLEEKNQVVTLSQEEAKAMIDSTTWTTTENKQVQVNNRTMMQRVYLLKP